MPYGAASVGCVLLVEKVPNAIRQWFWNGSTLYVELIPVLLEKLHIFYDCKSRSWLSRLLTHLSRLWVEAAEDVAFAAVVPNVVVCWF